MFKSLDNNNSIPNNYVYTSNRGTEYMYLEGSWVNCETMKIVENAHTFKMNQSAIRQIAEHNEKNSLQIGKKYVINANEYTYVGRNNFSLQGNLLSEGMNTRIHRLVEANTDSFKNFTRADPSNLSIPNKFYLTNGQYTYHKDSNTWYGPEGKVTDKQYNSELNADALKDIEKYNKQDRYPVNSTIQYGGKTYTYTGMNWVSQDGTKMSDKFLYKVDDWLDENPEVEKQSKEATSEKNPESTQSSNSSMKVGQRIQDPHGKVYTFDGTDFVDSSGTKLPADKTAKIIQKHKEWQDAKANGTEDEYQKNNTINLGSENPEEPQNSSQPEPATDTTNDSSDTSQPESSSESTSAVPNGYVYKSKKGNSYFKKNGQWFNAGTKKPINSSSVPMLERAAQAEITRHNSTASVKIGQEFTSKKGITYRYVGGNRFISDNGKLLPPDTAQKVMANLWQKADDAKKGQEQGAPQEEPQDQAQDSSTETGTSEPQPEQNSKPDSQSAPEGSESLQGLANEIKSNPKARNIVVLLSRGDDLSLLAADILLSGQQKEAAEILKSLNTED